MNPSNWLIWGGIIFFAIHIIIFAYIYIKLGQVAEHLLAKKRENHND